jgi:cell division protein FtsI/penicillin-binding protein 2
MASAEPILSNDIETGGGVSGGVNLPPEPEMKGPLKPVAETTPTERVFAVIAGITVCFAIAAMVVEGGAIVVVGGILSIIMGPMAYYQQTRLTDIATLKETTAAVQVEVDRLTAENVRLKSSIDELGTTVEDLQDVEQALDIISKTAGQSVDALEEQVKQNQDILSRMKKSTRGRIIQNLISVIYRGDQNFDNVISEEEATKVVESLSDVSGLTFREEKLRAAITGKSIEAIVGVLQNLLSSDTSEEERIFLVTEETK